MTPKTNRRHNAAPSRALMLFAPLLFIFLYADAGHRAAPKHDAAIPAPADATVTTDAALPSVDTGWTTGPVEQKREGAPPSVARAVRTSSHGTYNRVVFEFDGSTPPGYRVEYLRRSARECGSGNAVAVAGGARLLVRLLPAQAHNDAGQSTVSPRSRRLKLGSLREMKLTCDFEADLEWVLGLTSAKRFRVLELTNPARVVVDVRK